MGIFSLKRGMATKAMTIAFVAYSALASGRGLIPHLCATLSSLPQSGAAHCVKPHSCCASTGDGTVLGAAPRDCAFCLIVHTPAHAAAQVAFVQPPATPDYDSILADSRVADPMADGANLCRAPPFA